MAQFRYLGLTLMLLIIFCGVNLFTRYGLDVELHNYFADFGRTVTNKVTTSLKSLDDVARAAVNDPPPDLSAGPAAAAVQLIQTLSLHQWSLHVQVVGLTYCSGQNHATAAVLRTESQFTEHFSYKLMFYSNDGDNAQCLLVKSPSVQQSRYLAGQLAVGAAADPAAGFGDLITKVTLPWLTPTMYWFGTGADCRDPLAYLGPGACAGSTLPGGVIAPESAVQPLIDLWDSTQTDPLIGMQRSGDGGVAVAAMSQLYLDSQLATVAAAQNRAMADHLMVSNRETALSSSLFVFRRGDGVVVGRRRADWMSPLTNVHEREDDAKRAWVPECIEKQLGLTRVADGPPCRVGTLNALWCVGWGESQSVRKGYYVDETYPNAPAYAPECVHLGGPVFIGNGFDTQVADIEKLTTIWSPYWGRAVNAAVHALGLKPITSMSTSTQIKNYSELIKTGATVTFEVCRECSFSESLGVATLMTIGNDLVLLAIAGPDVVRMPSLSPHITLGVAIVPVAFAWLATVPFSSATRSVTLAVAGLGYIANEEVFPRKKKKKVRDTLTKMIGRPSHNSSAVNSNGLADGALALAEATTLLASPAADSVAAVSNTGVEAEVDIDGAVDAAIPKLAAAVAALRARGVSVALLESLCSQFTTVVAANQHVEQITEAFEAAANSVLSKKFFDDVGNLSSEEAYKQCLTIFTRLMSIAAQDQNSMTATFDHSDNNGVPLDRLIREADRSALPKADRDRLASLSTADRNAFIEDLRWYLLSSKIADVIGQDVIRALAHDALNTTTTTAASNGTDNLPPAFASLVELAILAEILDGSNKLPTLNDRGVALRAVDGMGSTDECARKMRDLQLAIQSAWSAQDPTLIGLGDMRGFWPFARTDVRRMLPSEATGSRDRMTHAERRPAQQHQRIAPLAKAILAASKRFEDKFAHSHQSSAGKSRMQAAMTMAAPQHRFDIEECRTASHTVTNSSQELDYDSSGRLFNEALGLYPKQGDVPLLEGVIVRDAVCHLSFCISTFSRYVPSQIISEILRNTPEGTEIGMKLGRATVFVLDLASFTTLSEKHDLDEMFAVLTRIFRVFAEHIMFRGGQVGKFAGDAIIAYWRADSVADPELRAVLSALACVESLKKLNERHEQVGLPQVGIRIGIASGPVFAGNIGYKKRYDYSMIGSTVERAHQMEGWNKTSGTMIGVDETVHDATSRHILYRQISAVPTDDEGGADGEGGLMHMYEPICHASCVTRERLSFAQSYELCLAFIERCMPDMAQRAIARHERLFGWDPALNVLHKHLEAVREAVQPQPAAPAPRARSSIVVQDSAIYEPDPIMDDYSIISGSSYSEDLFTARGPNPPAPPIIPHLNLNTRSRSESVATLRHDAGINPLSARTTSQASSQYAAVTLRRHALNEEVSLSGIGEIASGLRSDSSRRLGEDGGQYTARTARGTLV